MQIDGYSWIKVTGDREFRPGAGNLSVHDRATLRHAFSKKKFMRGSWTDHSLKDKVEADRAFPQRTPGKKGIKSPGCPW